MGHGWQAALVTAEAESLSKPKWAALGSEPRTWWREGPRHLESLAEPVGSVAHDRWSHAHCIAAWWRGGQRIALGRRQVGCGGRRFKIRTAHAKDRAHLRGAEGTGVDA